MDGPREERRARNETSFRKVNEAITAGRPLADAAEPRPVVCECGRLGCTLILALTPEAYRAVRSNPRRFVVADGHESPEIECVVSRHEGWAVVEKIGEAGKIAEEES